MYTKAFVPDLLINKASPVPVPLSASERYIWPEPPVCPTTCKLPPGEVVPIPTAPRASIVNLVWGDESVLVEVLNLNSDSGPDAASAELKACISDSTLAPGEVVSEVKNSILPKLTLSQSPTFKFLVSVNLNIGSEASISNLTAGAFPIPTLPEWSTYSCGVLLVFKNNFWVLPLYEIPAISLSEVPPSSNCAVPVFALVIAIEAVPDVSLTCNSLLGVSVPIPTLPPK